MIKNGNDTVSDTDKVLKNLEQVDLELVRAGRAGNEENVKNMIVTPLLECLGYDKIEHMDWEHPVLRKKRIDIALFINKDDKISRKSPNVIVETKSLDTNLDDHVSQALNYAWSKGVDFVVLTNGQEIRIYRSYESGKSENERLQIEPIMITNLRKRFKKIESIVGRMSLSTIVEKEKEEKGLLLGADAFEEIIAKCENIMRESIETPTTGKKAFDEFNKILFMKLYEDETKSIDPEYVREFTVKKINEKKDNEGKDRYVQYFFKKVREHHKKRGATLFSDKEQINLSPTTIIQILALLEPYNLYTSSVVAKATVYEKFIDGIFRGKEGQYFTPRSIVKFMVNLVGAELTEDGIEYGNEGKLVADPACGSGGFLVIAFETMRKSLDKKFKDIETDTEGNVVSWKFKNNSAKSDYEQALSNLKNNCLIGMDNDYDLAATARMNMIMHGDGSSNIHYGQSLDKENSIWKNVVVKIILTNPPFGLTIGNKDKKTKIVPDEEMKILKQYTLTKRGWDSKTNTFKPIKVSPTDSQILFIEKCLDSLEEGGYLCTVVDDGLLSNIDPKSRAVRETILERSIVRAIISIPPKTFKSKESGVKPSILLLKKKKAGLVQGKVFMTHVEHVGIDASGNVDKDHLNEIVIPNYRKWIEK